MPARIRALRRLGRSIASVGSATRAGKMWVEAAGTGGGYAWTMTTYAGRGGSSRWETELTGPLIAPLPA
ncbi:MAG: hypothetical protein LBF75_12045, partial [Treponema sp.]|nr:hypothetical protein [Treponema sp.]